MGELEQYAADRDLSFAELTARVSVAEALGRSLEELDSLPAPELDDWLLLYTVELEEAASAAENAKRREG